MKTYRSRIGWNDILDAGMIVCIGVGMLVGMSALKAWDGIVDRWRERTGKAPL